MAININNNTVVRLITRRGTDLERTYATLAAGELAYTIDTKRLFGGDGTTRGGTVIGNKFLGAVDVLADLSDVQRGDIAYENYTQQLWAMDPDSGEWLNISAVYPIPTTIAGVGLNYSTTVSGASNLYPASVETIQLDSTYWSLCAAGYSNLGRFYFGNVASNTWGNLDTARVAVDGPLFVNGTTAQIQLSAGTSCSVNFVSSGIGTGITRFTTASSFIFTAGGTATSGAPSFIFDGDPSTNGAVLVRSNLFVAGSAYFSNPPTITITNQTSLTSLLADTTGHPSLTALVLRNTDAAVVTMVDVMGQYGPLVAVNTAPWVGIHTNGYYAVSSYDSYNTVVSGKTLFDGSVKVNSDLSVIGTISATGDIVGFTSSDSAFKDNIVQVTGALDKLLSLRGVEFDWNSKSIYTGHDVGVIAQEVETVLPSAVQTRPDGYKGVKYEKLIPLIIEAIRELRTSK